MTSPTRAALRSADGATAVVVPDAAAVLGQVATAVEEFLDDVVRLPEPAAGG